MDPPPRMRITTSAPGEPSAEVTCTPASRPARASAAEDNGTSFNCFALTDDTEPVRSLLLTEEYPTTTTSFRVDASTCIGTSKVVSLEIFTSFALYPTKENCSVVL